METKYKWLPINEIAMINQVKSLQLQMRCRACDIVLIDRTGRLRTKERIWEYSSAGHVLGNTHEGCAYMIEVEGIEANTKDPNFGRAPTEWV